MYWVKLTRSNGRPVWVNLERFDTIFMTEDDDEQEVTRLVATLSETEEDSLCIDVDEKPDDFIPAMETG